MGLQVRITKDDPLNPVQCRCNRANAGMLQPMMHLMSRLEIPLGEWDICPFLPGKAPDAA